MKQPNIILIQSDQHNPKITSVEAHPYVRTPNIDKLSNKGIYLENCYCNSPLCVPSRSSMLSGLLPTNNGIYNNHQCLPSDKATFVHSLNEGGYTTVLAGRMHFVGYDQFHGYQKRLVGDITPSMFNDRSKQKRGELEGCFGQHYNVISKSGPGNSCVIEYDNQVADAACEYIKNYNSEKPLFMTVGFYSPHCPYVIDKERFDYYYNLLPEQETITQEELNELHPAIKKWISDRELEKITPEDIRRVKACYYGLVEFLDFNIGKVLNRIEKTLDLDNTVIIYCSDHGDILFDHNMCWKSNFYEGSSRVPIVFSYKGRFKEGVKMKGLTSLLDLAPTILSLAKCNQLPEYDGEDISEYLKGNKDIDKDKVVISQLCDCLKPDNPSVMIRQGKYKLIIFAGYESEQLFDIEKDPDELTNLADLPEYQEIVNKLKNILKKYWDSNKMLEVCRKDKVHNKLVCDWKRISKDEDINCLKDWNVDEELNYLL